MIKYNNSRYGWVKPTELELETYRTAIRALTNNELLEDCLELAQGDSWEGEFTTHGQYVYWFLEEELRQRLLDSGFLTTES